MSKLLILTRVLLKTSLSQGEKKRKKTITKWLLILLLIVGLGSSFSFPLGLLFNEMYDLLAKIDQQGVLLTLAVAGVSLAVFIFGIFYVLAVFYFAKDVELLLPLPLKPSQILGAKFITVLVYEYITELLILLPALVVFGVKSGAGILYYLYGLLLFLVIPIVPLVLASLINMIIMRFTNLGKHKDALRIIGGILALSIGLGFSMISQKMGQNSGDTDAMVKLLIEGDNSLVSLVSKIFPTAKLASLSLIYSSALKGIINLLLFVGISVAAVILFMIVGELLYFKGVLGNSEVYSRRKNLSSEQLDKSLRRNSAMKAFMLKEIRILFRTPSYLLNCVIGSFIWPVFIIIGMFGSGSVNSDQGTAVLEVINYQRVLAIVLAVIFAISVVFSGGNGIASTSISRDGQNLYISKYIPLSFKDQIIARIMPGFILSSISVLLTLGVAFFAIELVPELIITGLIVSVLGILLTSFVGILLELKFPKLNWDNEEKAVKQNLNYMVVMFGSIILAGAVVVLIVLLTLSFWYAFAAIVLIFGGIDLGLYYLILNKGKKWFDSIEV
jgi:ABC-2 type transport system permease protein